MYDAIVALGEAGADDAATIALLIELVTSDLVFEGEVTTPWAETGTFHVSHAAASAIGALGERAIEALIERIGAPQRPADAALLERAAHLGRPLFALARILVTDGELVRARAAELVVARFASELAAEEAIGIYLAVLERERYAARPLPAILRAIWPAFQTAEMRRAIADRWLERDLEAWIAERLDRDAVAACALGAILIAGPPDAERLIGDMLTPLADEGRWLACEAMLVVDVERLGRVLLAHPSLHGWATDRARAMLRHTPLDLELRLVIACSADPGVFEALLASRAFTRNRFLRLLRDVQPLGLRAALVARRGGAMDVASYPLTAAILAIDGTSFTGAGTDED